MSIQAPHSTTTGVDLCIFPEGKLTANGDMNTFRDGIEKIIKRRAVPVIPMALQGLWGSVFSRYQSNIFYRLFKGFKSCVGLAVGDMIEAQQVSASMLLDRVQDLYSGRK